MLAIMLDKPSYVRGETFTASVQFDSKGSVKCRKFVATLICDEKTNLKEMQIDAKEEVHIERLYELEQVLASDCELSPGRYKVAIKIPENAPPSDYEYGSDHKIRIWKLHVKLDIPLAPDEHAEKEVHIHGIEDE